MTRAHIEQTFAELIEARLKGDARAIAKHFAPDATYRMSGTPDLGPMTAIQKGREAIEAVVADLCRNWDFSDFPVVSLHIDGDTAYSTRRGTVSHIPTNTRMNFELLDRVVFRDGKITEFVEFLDTYDVHRIVTQQRADN